MKCHTEIKVNLEIKSKGPFYGSLEMTGQNGGITYASDKTKNRLIIFIL